MLTSPILEIGVTSPRVISVVDDDLSVRRALKRLLNSVGYDVRVFSSAKDFLDHGMSAECVLILDIQMADMDGFELLKTLANSGCRFPVIFITAHESREAENRAINSGAVAFLQKPFAEHALLNAVNLGIAQDCLIPSSLKK